MLAIDQVTSMLTSQPIGNKPRTRNPKLRTRNPKLKTQNTHFIQYLKFKSILSSKESSTLFKLYSWLCSVS